MPLKKTFCPYGSLMACEFLVQSKSAGGIHLPDKGGDDITASMGEVQKAIVIAIGPEVRYYKPGDIVLVRNGMFLKHKGQKYAMLPEEETFGCENRELQKCEDTTLFNEKKLKSMIFEEISETLASMAPKEEPRKK